MNSLKAVLLTVAAVAGFSSGTAYAASLPLVVVNQRSAPLSGSLSYGAAVAPFAVPPGDTRRFVVEVSGDVGPSLTLSDDASGVVWTATYSGQPGVLAVASSGAVSVAADRDYSAQYGFGPASSIDGVDTLTVVLALLLAGASVYAFRAGVRDGYAR